MDWSDNFSLPIEKTAWGRYGYGYQTPGNGYLGRYLVENTFTRNGSLVLRTQYVAGEWTCAGVSSGDFLNVAGGRWEIRAKFGSGKGIGYAFLLWPWDNSWPPEVDFVEGTVNGPKIMGSYHWGTASNEQKELRYLQNPDMKGWHTYGVIVGTDRLTYTFDGQPWTVIVHPGVTTMKMALDFQTAALDPNGIFKPYETVPGGVPNPETPSLVEVEIDWAAHYVAA
jgi:beta-glucanase (GH16 family)